MNRIIGMKIIITDKDTGHTYKFVKQNCGYFSAEIIEPEKTNEELATEAYTEWSGGVRQLPSTRRLAKFLLDIMDQKIKQAAK